MRDLNRARLKLGVACGVIPDFGFLVAARGSSAEKCFEIINLWRRFFHRSFISIPIDHSQFVSDTAKPVFSSALQSANLHP